jgi:hypothetical protein
MRRAILAIIAVSTILSLAGQGAAVAGLEESLRWLVQRKRAA